MDFSRIDGAPRRGGPIADRADRSDRSEATEKGAPSIASFLAGGSEVEAAPPRAEQKRTGAQPLVPLAVGPRAGAASWLAVQTERSAPSARASSSEVQPSSDHEAAPSAPRRTRDRPSAGPGRKRAPAEVRDLIEPHLFPQEEKGAPSAEEPARERSLHEGSIGIPVPLGTKREEAPSAEEPPRERSVHEGSIGIPVPLATTSSERARSTPTLAPPGASIDEKIAASSRALDGARIPVKQLTALTGISVDQGESGSGIVRSSDRFFRVHPDGTRERLSAAMVFHLWAKATAESTASTDTTPNLAESGDRKPGFFEKRELRAQARSAALIFNAGPEWAAIDLKRFAGADPNVFLAIGPSGLYAVSIHDHGGKAVAIGADVVQVKGVRYPYIPNARELARSLSERLTRAAGLKQPITVHPVVVFAGSGRIMPLGRQAKDVTILRAEDLTEWLRESERRLSPRTVQKLQKLAVHPSVWS